MPAYAISANEDESVAETVYALAAEGDEDFVADFEKLPRAKYTIVARCESCKGFKGNPERIEIFSAGTTVADLDCLPKEISNLKLQIKVPKVEDSDKLISDLEKLEALTIEYFTLLFDVPNDMSWKDARESLTKIFNSMSLPNLMDDEPANICVLGDRTDMYTQSDWDKEDYAYNDALQEAKRKRSIGQKTLCGI